MANEKISGMSAAATLTGSELVEVVQSGDNVRTTTQAIADLATGSGVTGTGTTNKVAKWTSSSALGNSSIDDLAAGLSIAKSAAGGQYINLIVDNTDDDIEVQLNLISNNTATVYQANFYLTDPNTLLTAGLTQDLDFLRWGYDTNGVDDIKVVIDKAELLMTVKGGSYTDGVLSADTASGIVKLGDIGNSEALAIIDSVSRTMNFKIANIDYLQISQRLVIIGTPATGTFISIDDANEIFDINCADLKINGTVAFSGTVAAPTSITVVNGIVTACS